MFPNQQKYLHVELPIVIIKNIINMYAAFRHIAHILITTLLISCGNGDVHVGSGETVSEFPYRGKYSGEVMFSGEDSTGRVYRERITLYYAVYADGSITSGANRIDPVIARACALGGGLQLTGQTTFLEEYRGGCDRADSSDSCNVEGKWELSFSNGVLKDHRELVVVCENSADARFFIRGERGIKIEKSRGQSEKIKKSTQDQQDQGVSQLDLGS